MRFFRRSVTAALSLLVVIHAGMSAGLARAAPLAAASAKAYSGADGVRVTIVRLADKKPAEALIKTAGTDTAIDGKVLRAELHEWAANVDFFTFQIDKHHYVLVTKRDDKYELYPPGKSGKSVTLKFDDKATTDVSADQIVAEYVASHPEAAK